MSKPIVDFGREVCGVYPIAAQREWLVTNGIGGYASGTVAGILTRRYHGYLVAALNPPLERTVLLAKLDEYINYQGVYYAVFSNQWDNGVVEPAGYQYLERFHLDGTTPVWTYALADALIEKRLWMQSGINTTYIQYRYVRGSGPLQMSVKALVNHRDHHAITRVDDWSMLVEEIPHGLSLGASDGRAPFYILTEGGDVFPHYQWNLGLFLPVEAYRGLPALEDVLHIGSFEFSLSPGEQKTLVTSTNPEPDLNGPRAYEDRRMHERKILTAGRKQLSLVDSSLAEVDQLLLAADQFVVHRSLPDSHEGRTLIAGYPWFGDWGRDTMISLSGLTLATGREDIARDILLTFSKYVDKGMLPNRFPEIGEQPEYNTVDATLWYFEALRAYHEATADDGLIRALFPILGEIIAWHRRGTRYQIQLDPDDGLLYAGEPSVQLTWMDVKIGEWVVTPRIGKPIEINALWYNALRVMTHFAMLIGESEEEYRSDAEVARRSFARFWNSEKGYCFDVLDSPEGNDPTLRPNQLFAVALGNSPLHSEQQQAIVDVCARYLYTSYGLRSLDPKDSAYVSRYGGDHRKRDSAYHQGTVWGWLLGPFIAAHLRVYKDAQLAFSFLGPVLQNLKTHGLGSLSEIFDSDPPHEPRGCIAQAWSVGEVLRIWQLIQTERYIQE